MIGFLLNIFLSLRFRSIIFLILVSCSVILKAEPKFAVRTGSQCGRCHVNISGGGKRTDFGNIFSQRFLAGQDINAQEGNNFTPHLTRTVSIGANLRLRNTSIYGYADTTEGVVVPDVNLLDITEGNFYIEVNLIPDRLILYFDQIISPNPGNRESFALLRGFPGNTYFKFGKILLPYGLRLWDDEAFIRETTGFTYSDPEIAAEIGLEPGKFSAYMAVTADQVSGLTAWANRHSRFGLSIQKSTNGDANRMFGAFAGLHAGRFTLLGEVDQIEFEGGLKQRAYFAELNFLLFRGYNFEFSYHLFDRNLAVPIERDGQERISIGIEAFPFQFFQVSAYYNINRFIPQNFQFNQDTFVVELHFFF